MNNQIFDTDFLKMLIEKLSPDELIIKGILNSDKFAYSKNPTCLKLNVEFDFWDEPVTLTTESIKQIILDNELDSHSLYNDSDMSKDGYRYAFSAKFNSKNARIDISIRDISTNGNMPKVEKLCVLRIIFY